MEWIRHFLGALWFVLAESSVWLLLGFLLAGVVHAFVPTDFLLRQLGRPGLSSITKAAAFGIPLPLCSCSVIPVAAGLRASGASKGAAAAFTISTPQTGEESIPLTWALFGPLFALARPVIAVATAFIAGLLIDRLATRTPPDHRDRGSPSTSQRPGAESTGPDCCTSDGGREPARCCGSGCGDGARTPIETCDRDGARLRGGPSARPRVIAAKIPVALRYGFITLPKDLAPWLVVGLGGAALVGFLVQAGWIESVAPNQWAQMGAMLLVGIPLYVCATSSTPLAYGLVVAGLSPGAALVLLLVGPATNLATMAWVYKDLGTRALVIYVSMIAAVGLLAGALVNAWIAPSIQVASMDSHDAHDTSTPAFIGAILLIALLAAAMWLRYIGPAFVDRELRRAASTHTDPGSPSEARPSEHVRRSPGR